MPSTSVFAAVGTIHPIVVADSKGQQSEASPGFQVILIVTRSDSQAMAGVLCHIANMSHSFFWSQPLAISMSGSYQA